MDGFIDGKPVLAKVTFAEAEVPLLNGQPTDYGLLAEVAVEGGVVRYFVPWTSVAYLRQEQSTAETGGGRPPAQPTTPTPTAPPISTPTEPPPP